MAQNNIVLSGYTLPTGIMSKNDVKSMQKSLGVTADGIWGPKTQAAYDTYVQQRGDAAKYSYPSLSPPIGVTTNEGVTALQNKLGVYSTGMWDQASQDMLDQQLIRQLPYNKATLADVKKLSQADQYKYDMLGYEYGIGRGKLDYAISGYDVPEWLNSKEKVATYQKLIGVTADGLWGPRTDAAHQKLLAEIGQATNNVATMDYALQGSTIPANIKDINGISQLPHTVQINNPFGQQTPGIIEKQASVPGAAAGSQAVSPAFDIILGPVIYDSMGIDPRSWADKGPNQRARLDKLYNELVGLYRLMNDMPVWKKFSSTFLGGPSPEYAQARSQYKAIEKELNKEFNRPVLEIGSPTPTPTPRSTPSPTATPTPSPTSTPRQTVGVNPDAYWGLIYDNSATNTGNFAAGTDSKPYIVEKYFEDTIDFKGLQNKAQNLYTSTMAAYNSNNFALDISPGSNENEYDVLKKMWDRPLPEIIARCLIFEFGDKDTPYKRVEACHTIINRMLRNFSDDRRFIGGRFDSEGAFQPANRSYNERQLKELLFGNNQFTTINFVSKFNDKDQHKTLPEYIKDRSSYTLSAYLGNSDGKETWQQACYMGTILTTMFENLQTPGQAYNEFYDYDPNEWKDLALSYHLAFDGILKSVYSDSEFTPYAYHNFDTYYDSWNSSDFYAQK